MSLQNNEKTELVAMLNKALADEWLAFYQYWIGAHVARGRLANRVVVELNEHAMEEFDHANKLVVRIQQLDGLPILDPAQWSTMTVCGYKVPRNPDTKPILEQNIQSEVCAIGVYKDVLTFIAGNDPVTHSVITSILADEEKHKKDLEELLAAMK